MSSTCVEHEGSSSGRWWYIQVWYNVFRYKGISSTTFFLKMNPQVIDM